MRQDPKEEAEYWGNMWGWKISYLGLGLIILMLGLMGFRKCQLNAEEILKPEQMEITDE